ncbi:hypothetical protein SAMN04487829_2640 [Pseudobutyrivibrio sp. NOR37]|uniref:Type VII secretion effector, SACOL2603 family n=1 Tax=Pseudobutyrivibrio xylanivorans TaxID=185007 RepID=A0A6M0LJW1_PSEXY|nr:MULTISPECIES: hypothetical protein [Pseudobutyrivibrio]NEX02822.1 hypothetical protein [Pseudobutyrivibrio xylanivorans]SFR85469.1 hypothetical protein SAMN04487829_2640 [Pseudobutyrivibrio sp. NOR37]
MSTTNSSSNTIGGAAIGAVNTAVAASAKAARVALDIDVFEESVKDIETQRDLIIEDSLTYAEIDAETNNNATVPTFVTANENIDDMLKSLKQQVTQVTETMHNVLSNYVAVDEDATRSVNYDDTKVKYTGHTV